MLTRSKAALLGATILCSVAASASAAPLITTAVDDAITTPVAGELSPLVSRAKDAGALADSRLLPHATLVLNRSPAMQAAFDKLVRDQQDRNSPSFHKWLTPAQLRAYGPDAADIATVTRWLASRGLTVNSVSPSGMSIDFGGSAAAIGAAFHTSLHNVTLKSGETHIANVTDLAIPAALAPVVRGATLSNFFPKPNMVKRVQTLSRLAPRADSIRPEDDVDGYELVSPADLATIYNLNPLFQGNSSIGTRIAGAGVTIAVVEQTQILRSDWKTFRKLAGLNTAAGKLVLKVPGCIDPGYTSDESEAAIDAEWSSAAAPDATIIEAACAGTALTFGVETTLEKLVENGTPASTLSISYGGPEQESSASFLAGWSNLLEEAASEGLSVMISSGDSGVSYDRNEIAFDGVAVNGLSSNPYNTTLGGTDFYDAALGKTATYWRPHNVQHYSSAKSYIPEIPWDNSCASEILQKFLGYANPQLSCNDPSNADVQDGVGGTGGQSTVYTKPSWQSAPGVPADGVRDQPDVSLFAANGLWGHFYPFCMSDREEGGIPCSFSELDGAGGTSFAAPIFAGIMALKVQYGGAKLGLVAPRLYELATTQFGSSTLLAQCDSTLGKNESSACVFNDVTAGNIAEPCYATTGDCFTDKNSRELGIGILRAPDMATVNAFPAQPGYSLATGLGSVNVMNLIIAY